MSDAEQPNLFDDDKPKRKRRKKAVPPSSPEAVPAAAGEDAPAPEPGAPAHQVRGPFRDLVDTNFIEYAAYVIKDRAIPDLDDGLKPVQRRILHSLHEKDDGKFIKVANIVGYTMQYHPHGDASIADALIGLTNKRYLIEGQGNFGNVFTGDAAAAPRYIECRLTDLARKELFNDALTEFVPSYDGRNQEPVTLPCKLPLLLMLGAEGIAVGLSTRILPHNFIELLEAEIAVLRKKPFTLYPDFQQGGLMDVSEYDRGNGRVKVRAVIEPRDKDKLVIREIPFGTTTDSVIASIEDATRKKKVKIRSISDFTAENIEIEITLQQGQTAETTIQALYAFTACEAPLSSNIVVIQDRRPVSMNVEEVVRYTAKRLVILLERELEHEKQKLLDELHRKTLVQIFIENRIYKNIEQCKTYEAVTQAVFDGVNKFRKQLRRDVTLEDVEMLLGVRIKRISLFDINKSKSEIDDIVHALDEVNKNLGRLTQYAIGYLKTLIKQYKDAFPRRTRIAQFETVELRELTANELTMRWDKDSGYFGSQVDGEAVFKCSSLDKLIFVWDDGRYKLTTPQDKVFVDHNLLYAAVFDRDRVMTAVYVHHGVAYFKKFAFGGTIMNRDYSCTLDDSKIILFTDQPVEQVYVKYAPVKNLRIKQQMFEVKDALVKGAKARGNQMTVKKIRSIATEQPRGWDAADGSPRGAMMDG